jgi:hypothetical protein
VYDVCCHYVDGWEFEKGHALIMPHLQPTIQAHGVFSKKKFNTVEWTDAGSWAHVLLVLYYAVYATLNKIKEKNDNKIN